ncbi:MAG: guanylate kinase [bacterium]|nr:guanylate kinase [bacterium]
MLGKVTPFPIVLTAPSGTGKTTICRCILKKSPQIRYSISATTRKPRDGEVDKKDYYFISKSTFKDWIKRGKFYEWAQVYGDLYGTPKEPLLQYLNTGHHVLLTLDIQGARSIKMAYPLSVCIFILPPSISELKVRLLKRDKDSFKVIGERLKAATAELHYASEFDYVVVNESLGTTVNKIMAIIVAEECSFKRLYEKAEKRQK